MKKYTLVHPLFMSFYSKPLYREVGRNWTGWGLVYLAFLLSLYWIPEMIRFHASLSEFMASEAPKVVSQMPTVTISKGEVSIDKPVPYSIYYPDKDTPLVIIDTSGKIASLENTKAVALVTKTKILMRRDDSDTRVFDLSKIDSLVIDQKRFYEWLAVFRDWSVAALYPFTLFFSFLYYAILLLACATVGSFFTRTLKTDLSYKALVRLAAVAFTPPLILQSVHTLLGIEFPYRAAISFMIAAGYLYYAVSANAETDRTE